MHMVSIKKRGVSVLLLLLVLAVASFFAIGCSMSVEAKDAQSAGNQEVGKYVPGTYTGEGNGMGGVIEVTLTVDADNIVSVDGITDPGETAGIGGKEAIADGTFAKQIIETQSADIDGVSGATITTSGIAQATTNALAQAINQQAQAGQ
jgi:uncharacterized protein with FMN-binding domain